MLRLSSSVRLENGVAFLETFFEKKSEPLWQVSNFQKTFNFYIRYFGFGRFLEISNFLKEVWKKKL